LLLKHHIIADDLRQDYFPKGQLAQEAKSGKDKQVRSLYKKGY
jgi:hypothetical protein